MNKRRTKSVAEMMLVGACERVAKELPCDCEGKDESCLCCACKLALEFFDKMAAKESKSAPAPEPPPCA